MIADKIKELRMINNITQIELAAELGITRSSVNAWEMGISIPSTMYVVELARIFHVSTDYLLGISHDITLDLSDLDQDAIQIVNGLVQYLKKKQQKK